MKKRLYISIIALTATLLSACNGMLTEESKVNISKDKYFRNASDAQNVLLGVYRNMATENLYSYNLSFLFDMPTDLAHTGGTETSSWREIPSNAFNASNSSVLNTWRDLYAAIFDANDFIETAYSRIGSFIPEDIEKTKRYIGEAKALRALYYFELVRWFGNIPLITATKQAYQDPSTFTQEDPVNVYKYIEQDLKDAINVLPWSTDNKGNGGEFRMSRGAAMGLLSKVYVTWAGAPIKDISKWQLAATMAGSLCNSGKHSLNPSFEKLWENTSNGVWEPNESLIEVSFYAPIITGTASQDPAGRIGKWNGVVADDMPGIRGRNAGNVKVIQTFFLDWKNTQVADLRRTISVANFQYKQSKKVLLVKGKDDNPKYTDEQAAIDDADPTKKQKEKQNYTPAKWDTEKYVLKGNSLLDADKSNINWYVLRYADVLLLYAEALNEVQGPTAEALEAINMVRRRGCGLDPKAAGSAADLPNTLSQEDFRQAIRKERAYELCFEGGRRQDLIRWGVYYQTIRQTYLDLSLWYDAANYIAGDWTVKGKHELFPIPQRELDMMKQVKQNPKW